MSKKSVAHIISLLITFILVLSMIGCENKAFDEPLPSIKSDYLRLSIVDWGTSREETLKALGLKEKDVEIVHFTSIDEKEYSCTVVEKVKLGGFDVSLLLYFATDEEIEKLGFDIGLTSARILCETKEVSNEFEKQIVGSDKGIASTGDMVTLSTSKKLIDITKDKKVENDVITALAKLSGHGEDIARKNLESNSTSITRFVQKNTNDEIFSNSEKLKDKSFYSMFVYNNGQKIALINHFAKKVVLNRRLCSIKSQLFRR